MTNRFITMCITIILAGQCLVSGVGSVTGDIILVNSETVAEMTAPVNQEIPEIPECQCEATCCSQAQSPLGLPVAKLCCEVVCGMSPLQMPAKQPEEFKSSHLPQPTTITLKTDSFKQLLSQVLPNFRNLSGSFPLESDPPALYLQNSAFLI